jgi:hypothetical protein
MISTEDWKVEQPTSKTLARHPLVLLDQQLKNLAKEDDVPYKDNRSEAQVEGPRFPKSLAILLWDCRLPRSLKPTAGDRRTGWLGSVWVQLVPDK